MLLYTFLQVIALLTVALAGPPTTTLVPPTNPLPSAGNREFKAAYTAAFARSYADLETYIDATPVQSPPLVHIADCPSTDQLSFPEPSSSGTLHNVISSGKVKVCTVAVDDPDPLHSWDPSTDPPTGFLATFFNAVLARLGQGYGVTVSPQWVYSYNATLCFDLLYSGMVDMVGPHFDEDVFWQSEAYPSIGIQGRRDAFDSACTFAGQDVAMYVRTSSGWTTAQQVKDAIRSSPNSYQIGSDGAGSVESGESYFNHSVTDYTLAVDGVELNVSQVFTRLRNAQGLDVIWDYPPGTSADVINLTQVLAGQINTWSSYLRYDDEKTNAGSSVLSRTPALFVLVLLLMSLI